MKKIDQKAFLTVLAIAVVALLGVYLLVFQKYNEKTEVLRAENTNLRGQVQIAKKHYDEREINQQRIDEIRTALDEMLAEYPADAREEDAVMMGVEMESVCGEEFLYSEINIDKPEVLYTIPQEEVVTAGVESLTDTIEFVERKVTYAEKMDYSDLKRCIQQIYSNPNRLGIYNVSVTKQKDTTDGDVSSYLQGNIDVAFYSVSGTGKVYTAPEIPEYEPSTSNPFQLIRSSRDGAPAEPAEAVQE